VIGSALALAPVGTVTSSSAFELSGSAVNIAGVPAWPILAGDSVTAGSSFLTISFRDGSRVTLAPGSRLKIDSSGSSANLTGGSMQFLLASGSGLRIFQSSDPVLGRSGSISTGSSPTGLKPELAKLPPPPQPLSGR